MFANLGAKMSKHRLRYSILSPSCSKMAPRWPNIAQHSAKMSQHSLQEQPQDPKKPSKVCTGVVFVVFAVFGKIAPKIKKRLPRCSQKCAKLAILGTSWRLSWATWRHLGSILGDLGAKMGFKRHFFRNFFKDCWTYGARPPKSYQNYTKKCPKRSQNGAKFDEK